MKRQFIPEWIEVEESENDYLVLKAEKKKQEAAEFLKAVIEQLYSQDQFDHLTFEEHLDELCFLLDVTLDSRDLNIDRKIQNKFKIAA